MVSFGIHWSSFESFIRSLSFMSLFYFLVQDAENGLTAKEPERMEGPSSAPPRSRTARSTWPRSCMALECWFRVWGSMGLGFAGFRVWGPVLFVILVGFCFRCVLEAITVSCRHKGSPADASTAALSNCEGNQA